MEVLLNEAMAMLGADHGGISLWDAPSGALIQVYSNNGRSNGLTVSLEGSLSGRAALSSGRSSRTTTRGVRPDHPRRLVGARQASRRHCSTKVG